MSGWRDFGSSVSRATRSVAPIVFLGCSALVGCGGSSQSGAGDGGEADDAGQAGDASGASGTSGSGGASSTTGGRSTGGSPGKGGGGSSGSGGMTGRAGASGAAMGGTGGTAGVGGGMAGAGGTFICNGVVNTAPETSYYLSADPPPTPLGGAITPGVYHWTSTTYHGGVASCIDPLEMLDIRYTVDVVVTSPVTGRFDVVLSTIGGDSRANADYELQETAFVTTPVCGAVEGATSTYTANATSIVTMRDEGDGCGTAVYLLEPE